MAGMIPPLVIASVGGLVMNSQLIAEIPLTTMYKMMPPKASVMIKAEARTSVKKTFCLKYRQLMELCFSFFICLHLQRRGTGLTEFVRYVIGDQIKRQGQTEQDHADGKKRLLVGAAIRLFLIQF